MINELVLDRLKQNKSFQSWRLAPSSSGLNPLCRHHLDLPSTLLVSMHEPSVNFLQARSSALHNHLMETSDGRLYIITRSNGNNAKGDGEAEGFTVHEVVHSGDEPSRSVTLSILTTISLCNNDTSPLLVSISPSLDPSFVLVDCSMDCSSALSHSLEPSVKIHEAFLVSSGQGDLTFIYREGRGQRVRHSPLVSPLRPLPPLHGCRPLSLKSAYLLPSGDLRVIAWAVKSPTLSSSHGSRSSCETYAVTFSLTTQSSESSPNPLILPPETPSQSTPPPHQTDDAGAYLLATPLALMVTEVRLLRSSTLPPHLVLTNPSTDKVLLALDPEGCEEHEAVDLDLDCRRGGEQAGHSQAVDDDMDPRTLAEAAARLAKYTQDEEDGMQQGTGGLVGGSAPRWCDVYKESGQDGVGAMGSEESVDFIVLPLSGGGGDGGGIPSLDLTTGSTPILPRAEWRLSCGASKALSFEGPGRIGGLVTLSDDVDGAVLAIQWQLDQDPVIKHVSYVDALAYLVAGKVHKKHLMVGLEASPVAALLVESSKFYYVYHKHQVSMGREVTHGVQDVVDMELRLGETVMGARLVDKSSPHPPMVLILTQYRVIWHVLRSV